MKSKHLSDEDIPVSKALLKIELALRRTKFPWDPRLAYTFLKLADEIAELEKDLWR